MQFAALSFLMPEMLLLTGMQPGSSGRGSITHTSELWLLFCNFIWCMNIFLLVHGQVTIIFVVSVCLFVCLFVCAEFFSAVFDPIWIKLGHKLHVQV